MLTAIGRIGLANDERFQTRDVRIKNYAVLTQVLAETFVAKPRAQWMALLEANDVPFAPVHNIPDVIADPQVEHLETFRTLRHPTEGEIVAIRRPVRIDGGRDGSDLPAPTFGQHTGEVLSELGYNDADIAKMRNAKVI
jgi:crotonobetainyl-CoA:carnitine CoA-transferase CaiB-like acyl-CoA transferase